MNKKSLRTKLDPHQNLRQIIRIKPDPHQICIKACTNRRKFLRIEANQNQKSHQNYELPTQNS